MQPSDEEQSGTAQKILIAEYLPVLHETHRNSACAHPAANPGQSERLAQALP